MREPVEVSLIGHDGNAFFIIGRVIKAMRQAGWSDDEIRQYQKEATSSDYDNLLRVTMKYTKEPE